MESVTISIYLISIFSMTLFSTLYHAMSPNSRHKEVFHILDHIFIYVAIAGHIPLLLYVLSRMAGSCYNYITVVDGCIWSLL